MAEPRYRPDEVQEILGLAIARASHDGDDRLGFSQLQEIAAELGIGADQLRQAEADWRSGRARDQERQTFLAQRWQRWRQGLARFGIINGFLVLLNWLLQQQLSWSLGILLLWGMLLALDTWRTAWPGEEKLEQQFQTWRRKRQLKQSVGGWLNRALGLDRPDNPA
mgnify:CR=1 FL=1